MGWWSGNTTKRMSKHPGADGLGGVNTGFTGGEAVVPLTAVSIVTYMG